MEVRSLEQPSISFFRCSQHNAPGHPRVPLNEEQIDLQILAIFDRMRIESDDVREWFAAQLRVRTQYEQDDARLKAKEMLRQLSLLRQHKNQLLNMRLNEEIDADGYAAKATEHRDREANFKLKLNACAQGF